MCNFCEDDVVAGEALDCAACNKSFDLCKGCVFTWQPCSECRQAYCRRHMRIEHWCEACYQRWRLQQQLAPVMRYSTQPNLFDQRDPFGDDERVALYVPVQHHVESNVEDELAFEHVDHNWYRRRMDNVVFHIKSKGDQTTCEVIQVASKLYRLLLGDEYAVRATAVEEDPGTDKPRDDKRWFVMKAKVQSWTPISSLLDPQPNQTCMVRFPAIPAIAQQLQHLGQAPDLHGRFGYPQYRAVPHGQRVPDWSTQGAFVDMNGTPLELRGLRELAVVAWFLGESDMHSVNFGVQPVGGGAYRVVVIDPSGTLDETNLELPLDLAGYNRLPFQAPEDFEVNGGWHLGGDDDFTFAPDVGLLPGQQGAVLMRAAIERIKSTQWQTIDDLLDEISDQDTRDRLGGLLQTRHQRLAQLFL